MAVSPKLIKSYSDSPAFPLLDISPTALAIIREGMFKVTNGELGTARKYNLEKSFGGMAGKTGTVQVKRITKAQREKGIVKNIDRPWVERDHALFVAYAPIKTPRYAISVIVEHGGSGSSTAAPIARGKVTTLEITYRLLDRFLAHFQPRVLRGAQGHQLPNGDR